MASSAAAAALPIPSCSSSEDSDDTKRPPVPPAPEETSRAPHQQRRRLRRWQLERDCNVAMKVMARAGNVDEVLVLFCELRRSGASGGGAPPNVLCYNTLLNALAVAGRASDARDVFDEMLASGVLPNVSSLNIMVKLHAWQSEFSRAYEYILEIGKLGVDADIGTYSTLIAGLCRSGKVAEAWGVLDLMLEMQCRPTVHTYTPIVHAYCRKGGVEEAKELMAAMERAGCRPNVVTYNVLIRALCDYARFDEVEQVLTESATNGWNPSAVTYNTYMNGLCKKGKAKEALELLDVMQGEGLDPTAFTLSILLNCLCHDSKVSDAIYLLERSTALKWYADVVAYNTVMSRLCGMEKWMGVLKLMTDMIKKGVMPNMRTFNIFIRSLCIGGKSSLAKSMVHSTGFTANVVTFNILIHWFYQLRKSKEVQDLILYMAVRNIAPDEVTHTILVDGLCSEGKFDKATNCFLESLKGGLSMDLLAVLINRLAHSGKIWEVHRVFEGKGLRPDCRIFDFTIRSFCRAGFCHKRDIFKLDLILDTMLGKK